MSGGWRTWNVGSRVVVRRRLPPGSADGHRFTDVIGHVLTVDDGGLTLRTDPPARDGSADGGGPECGGRGPRTVVVPAAEIAAGRVVPERRQPGRRQPGRHPGDGEPRTVRP
jgi:hypothetical protein